MVPPLPPPLAYRPPYIEKMARLLEIRVQKQQLVNLLGQVIESWELAQVGGLRFDISPQIFDGIEVERVARQWIDG
jgi:hypothetical protein